MRDPLDILLYDWPFVQCGGDIMSGCADHLHAALVSALIGIASLEGGKETVVDVDDAPGEISGEFGAENLHIPREDSHVDRVFIQK